MVGKFTFGLAITAPIVMFSNLNFRGLIATDVTGRFHFSDYLGVRMIMNAIALGSIVIILFLSGSGMEIFLIGMVLGVAKIFESQSDLYYGFAQQHERMDFIARSMVLKGTTSLVLLGICTYYTGSIVWGSMGLAVAWAGNFLVYDKSIFRKLTSEVDESSCTPLKIRPSFQFPVIKTLVFLSLPLGFATLLNSLMTNVPRYVLMGGQGERAVGIFSALSYFVIIGARIVTALGDSALPRLARFLAEGHRERYGRLLAQMVLAGFLLGSAAIIVAWIAGYEILMVVYRQEYAAYKTEFVLLLAAAALGYMGIFLQYGLTAARCYRPQPFIQMVSLAALTVGCFALVGAMGLRGAAYAVLISQALYLAGTAVSTWIVYQGLSDIRMKAYFTPVREMLNPDRERW